MDMQIIISNNLSEIQKIIGFLIVFVIILLSFFFANASSKSFYKKIWLFCLYSVAGYVVMTLIGAFFWFLLWLSIIFKEIIQWFIETLWVLFLI